MISDFGLSKMEGTGNVMSTACGTPGYVGEFQPLLLPVPLQPHSLLLLFNILGLVFLIRVQNPHLAHPELFQVCLTGGRFQSVLIKRKETKKN